jgi:twitching motility protein PilT
MTTEQLSMRNLLRRMVEKGASDLHLTAGAPPSFRIDGAIIPERMAPLAPHDAQSLVYAVLDDQQKAEFERTNELDLSFGVPGLARFRGNLFMQRGTVAGAFRQIPFKILGFDDLGLPPVVSDLANRPSGLVLVTGPTGSGKTTTLAALIDKINSEQRFHILTIEDPIEYLHPNKLSIINQREIGTDTNGFRDALRYVLRQDPDVVLIGEMRDLETIEAALTISETGHLVFATLHTNSAISSITRMIDAFPPHQQGAVRAKLSFSLQGVVTQQLVPRANGPGRVLASEVLVPNAAIRNLIREDKLHQVYGLMQVGQERHGMQTLNQCLMSLYRRGMISLEDVWARTSEPEEIRNMLAQAGAGHHPSTTRLDTGKR